MTLPSLTLFHVRHTPTCAKCFQKNPLSTPSLRVERRLEDELYPWGEGPDDENFSTYLNSWEGKFPKENLKHDGYVGVAPADAYDPNAYVAVHGMPRCLWHSQIYPMVQGCQRVVVSVMWKVTLSVLLRGCLRVVVVRICCCVVFID